MRRGGVGGEQRLASYRELPDRERDDFVAFYEREQPRLFRLLLVISHDRQIAAEATDETFVRVLERWERIRSLDCPEAYVKRIGINLIKRHHRQRQRESSAFARHGIPDVEIADDYLIELLDLMSQLSRRARVAIALRYVFGMTEQQTAQVMGVSTGTVGTTVHRARKRLAELLADRDEIDTRVVDLFGGDVA